MKILGVIDSFGSGGAQRQFVELMCGLVDRGHEVEIVAYYPQFDFHRAQVEGSGICIHECRKTSRFTFSVVNRLIQIMSRGTFDIVVSFLDAPNVYSELAKFLSNSSAVHVVSERASHYAESGKVLPWIRRNSHRIADHIVANSHSHTDWLVSNHRWLQGKVSCIYNGVSLDRFSNQIPLVQTSKLIAIGRICPDKNVMHLVDALDLFKQRNGWAPVVEWVGRVEDSRVAEGYKNAIEKKLLESSTKWEWMGERKEIPQLLSNSYGLVLPSINEGLPNVVCEAFAAGRPVLASFVCDNGILVKEGERGFLFDPHDTESICISIEKLFNLQFDEWVELGRNCRDYAERELSLQKMISSFETLFLSLMSSAGNRKNGRGS